MVFKFRLLSDEVKDFVRDVEIRGDQTFFDFHRIIQDDLGYDNSQIASFFLTNSKWEKEREFTLFDMSDGENKSLVPMDKAILKNYLHDQQQRLIYVFDFFNERSLYIEVTDIQKEILYSDYPAVIFSKGIPPQQILFSNNSNVSFSDLDIEGMNFGEDFGSESAEGFISDDDDDSEEKLSDDFLEESQDAESEE